MDELFLEAERGRIPVGKDMIDKYNLKKGMTSPFTNYRIIAGKGGAAPGPESEKSAARADECQQILTASEIIDFAQGADS